MIKKIQNYLRKVNPMGACLAFILGFFFSAFAADVFKSLGIN